MRRKVSIPIIAMAVVLCVVALIVLNQFNLLPRRTYTAEDFGIQTVLSDEDFNENGVDDYTDILLGARADAKNHPTYNGAYYEGGYPPASEKGGFTDDGNAPVGGNAAPLAT